MKGQGHEGMVRRQRGWWTCCLEEPRLEGGQAAPDAAEMPGSGLAFLCGRVCEGGLGDGSARLGGGTALPMSLVILDRQSSSPLGKGAHCSLGPSAASVPALSPAALLPAPPPDDSPSVMRVSGQHGSLQPSSQHGRFCNI